MQGAQGWGLGRMAASPSAQRATLAGGQAEPAAEPTARACIETPLMVCATRQPVRLAHQSGLHCACLGAIRHLMGAASSAAHRRNVCWRPAKEVGLHGLRHGGAALRQHAACLGWGAAAAVHSQGSRQGRAQACKRSEREAAGSHLHRTSKQHAAQQMAALLAPPTSPTPCPHSPFSCSAAKSVPPMRQLPPARKPPSSPR